MTDMNQVISTLSYVKRFLGKTILLKLGGAALTEPELVARLCQDIRVISSVGIRLVVVHGGGPEINKELERRGIKWDFVDGLRVTSPEMMSVIESVLCGTVNRRVIRQLNQAGLTAVGLSGADGGTLMCRQKSAQLGMVGVVESVRTDLINAILDQPADFGSSMIPVIAPVGTGREGEAFNINADWAASRIAQALGIKKVIYLTDQDGILGPNKELLTELDAAELEQLIEAGTVQGGMRAKTETIVDALKNGVMEVHVINGKRPHALIEELFTERGSGTLCRLRSRARG